MTYWAAGSSETLPIVKKERRQVGTMGGHAVFCQVCGDDLGERTGARLGGNSRLGHCRWPKLYARKVTLQSRQGLYESEPSMFSFGPR